MTYSGTHVAIGDGDAHLGGNIIEGDPFTFAPSVWLYLIDRFDIRSVLDLGSGFGYSAAFFFRRGLQVVAVDGLDFNVKKAVYPTIKIDLTKEAVSCGVDLVHCQEVVEHIEEIYLANLLDSLCCGPFILMTHALPGQGGHHHVNEQPQEYWVEHLGRRGYTLLSEDTARVRELANRDKAVYLSRTGLVFSNKDRIG